MQETVSVQIPPGVMQQIIESTPPLEQLSQRERSRALECLDGTLQTLHEHRKAAQDIRQYFQSVIGAEGCDAATIDAVNKVIQSIDLEIEANTKAFDDLAASGPH